MALVVAAMLPPLAESRAQDPPAIDLSGRWQDGSRPVEIEQSGSSVVARYVVPPLCDPQDGSEPQPREIDFEGSLSADGTLEGEAYVCNWGEEWGGEIGIQKVDMTLVLSDDGDTLTGTYESMDGPAEMTLTRGCPDGDGGELSAEEVVAAIVEGFRSRGVDLGPEHVYAGRSEGGNWTYAVRLDGENRPLPGWSTIEDASDAALIAEGSQTGAEWILMGAIQSWEEGNQTRVTARRVRVETAEVAETGRGDADGTDPCAIAEAFAQALDAMGISIGEPQGIVE